MKKIVTLFLATCTVWAAWSLGAMCTFAYAQPPTGRELEAPPPRVRSVPYPRPERLVTETPGRPRAMALAAANASPYQMWRDELVADNADRNYTYIWRWCDPTFPGPYCDGTVTLINTATSRSYPVIGWTPSGHVQQWYERYYHQGFILSPGTPPGAYRVMLQTPGGIANDTGLKLTVKGKPQRLPTVIVSPSGSADDTSRIEQAFSTGNVVLNPGLYRLNRPHPNQPNTAYPLIIPAGRTLHGYGAVIKHEPSANYTNPRVFFAQDDLTFYGVTFNFPNQLVWSDTLGRNMGFVDCKFENGATGHWLQHNGFFENCEFKRAAIGPSMGCLYVHNCTFDGMCPVTHSFLMEGGDRNVMMCCKFTGTDRGLVLRSGWMECVNNLFCSIHFEGISWTPNGNELITTEGNASLPGMNRNMFFRLRTYNTEGQINLWDGIANDNLFWDITLDRGGFMLSGLVPQKRNRLIDLELRGGGILIGNLATDTEINRCAIVDWRPTRANQFYSHPDYYKTFKGDPDPNKRRNPVSAIGPAAASNKIYYLTVSGTIPDAVATVSGATIAAATQ